MQLTESESTGFWPLYRQYRAEQEKVGDGLVKLVLEYADLYPNVPEDRARLLLKDYTALEKKLADIGHDLVGFLDVPMDVLMIDWAVLLGLTALFLWVGITKSKWRES